MQRSPRSSKTTRPPSSKSASPAASPRADSSSPSPPRCRSPGCATCPAATATAPACSSNDPPPAGAPTHKSPTRCTRPTRSTADPTTHPATPDCSTSPGWEQMPVTAAAQAVQRSAFPNAYAKHEARAAAIVEAITGAAPDACRPLASRQWVLPLAEGSYRLTSGFGPRTHPIRGTADFHTGLDFAAPLGTPVVAVTDGEVISAGPGGGYGNLVKVGTPTASNPGTPTSAPSASNRANSCSPARSSAASAPPAAPPAHTYTSRSASTAAPPTPPPGCAARALRHDWPHPCPQWRRHLITRRANRSPWLAGSTSTKGCSRFVKSSTSIG